MLVPVKCCFSLTFASLFCGSRESRVRLRLVPFHSIHIICCRSLIDSVGGGHSIVGAAITLVCSCSYILYTSSSVTVSAVSAGVLSVDNLSDNYLCFPTNCIDFVSCFLFCRAPCFRFLYGQTSLLCFCL